MWSSKGSKIHVSIKMKRRQGDIVTQDSAVITIFTALPPIDSEPF